MFDKFSYFAAAVNFVLSALAAHYQMHWLWQVSTLLLGVLCELSVYQIDIWEDVSNPLKVLSFKTAVIAVVLTTFSLTFLYQLNARHTHIQNFFRWEALYAWLLVVSVSMSCIWAAINIADYLAPKAMIPCTLKIVRLFSKAIPRAGTTNYLNAVVNGVEHKFVLSSVAYDVLKNKSEIEVNLWQGFSGSLFVKNDFLRGERSRWRIKVFKVLLFLLLLIVVGCGLVYYLAMNDQ